MHKYRKMYSLLLSLINLMYVCMYMYVCVCVCVFCTTPGCPDGSGIRQVCWKVRSYYLCTFACLGDNGILFNYFTSLHLFYFYWLTH